MKKRLIKLAVAIGIISVVSAPITVHAENLTEVGEYGRPFIVDYTDDTEEQIEEEELLGDMELVAQLVEAEAGNQTFEGKCLVVDVVLNRLESDDFPDTIEEIIFQERQFSVISNGAWENAAWNMQESDYAAVAYEFEHHTNKDVLYFNNSEDVSGTGKPFKVGGHWFNS